MCTSASTALDGKMDFARLPLSNMETWTDVVYTKIFKAGNAIKEKDRKINFLSQTASRLSKVNEILCNEASRLLVLSDGEDNLILFMEQLAPELLDININRRLYSW